MQGCTGLVNRMSSPCASSARRNVIGKTVSLVRFALSFASGLVRLLDVIHVFRLIPLQISRAELLTTEAIACAEQ